MKGLSWSPRDSNAPSSSADHGEDLVVLDQVEEEAHVQVGWVLRSCSTVQVSDSDASHLYDLGMVETTFSVEEVDKHLNVVHGVGMDFRHSFVSSWV